jgi:hypothetical protein
MIDRFCEIDMRRLAMTNEPMLVRCSDSFAHVRADAADWHVRSAPARQLGFGIGHRPLAIFAARSPDNAAGQEGTPERAPRLSAFQRRSNRLGAATMRITSYGYL